MRLARERGGQHVLAFHVRGRATVTRTMAGVRTTKFAAPGSIAFTPADAAFESWIESPSESVHIYIDAAALPIAESAGGWPDWAMSFIGARDPWLVGYFQMLVSECERLAHPEPLAESEFLTETEHLLLRHLRQCDFRAADGPHASQAEHGVHPLRPALLRRIEEYVEAHLDQDIPLKPLATIAHMSVDHFVRTFRAATGKTPHQYVLERRLERAALLLRRDNVGLADVATACGFRSPSHFSMRFSAQFGTSPARYRRST
jgi:AraC family transcriptional regulator